MEKIRKLLEQDYPTRQTLAKRYGALAAEALYAEWEQAKRCYQVEMGLEQPQDYIAFTPYVQKRQYEAQVLLLHGTAHYARASTIDPRLPLGAWFEQTLRQFGLYERCSFSLRALLRQPACDPLLLLFCFQFLAEPYAAKLMEQWRQWFLSDAPFSTPALYLDRMLCPDEYAGSDKTYLFLRFLEQIVLKFKECLLLLSSDSNTLIHVSQEELIHRYPQLSVQQIAFFAAHRRPGEYYSIRDYMRFADVCYETSRQAMERLTRCRLYGRRKIGKRFVYSLT